MRGNIEMDVQEVEGGLKAVGISPEKGRHRRIMLKGILNWLVCNSAGSCEHDKPLSCLKGLAIRVTVSFSGAVMFEWGLDLISMG
jgi:hypothetical protein